MGQKRNEIIDILVNFCEWVAFLTEMDYII